MGFDDFFGNLELAGSLRRMLAAGRLPHAVILAGPQGAGKFTLAQMLAKTMLCLEPVLRGGLPDFCGRCANCLRIGESDDLETRIAEAIQTREDLREADRRETRIFVQSHPDVLIVPPDPPQKMIKVDQVRHATETMHFLPSQGTKKIYIFTESCFMKEAANALLKGLEEPPEFAYIFLLTRNPGELLSTIRSRCVTFRLAPLRPEELEQMLSRTSPQLSARQRALIARLSNGGYGRAQSFDLEAHGAIVEEALLLLSSPDSRPDHSLLFRATETYRAGAEGAEKMQALLRAIYALLQDLIYLKSGAKNLVQNIDRLPQLEALAKQIDFAWINAAARQLMELESSMRRNPLRPLALDAFAASLEK